ncbi:MAG: DUF6265 family protein [Pseudomonadota bacterium]
MRAFCWIALSLMAGCATGPGDDRPLQKMEWLLGDWHQVRQETVRSESWIRVAPGVYRGLGQLLERDGGEVRFSEALLIYEIDGAITYMAHVAENDLPVPFKLTTLNESRAVFENPTHDFPRRLDYQLVDDCRLTVSVSDGADQGFSLNFTRMDSACRNRPAESD